MSDNYISKPKLLERICIGLFADYDDLSLESAEYNWQRGLGYAAVGSDGYHELMKSAKLIYQSIVGEDY